MGLLSRTEEMLLLIVCSLQDDAFGANIREEVERITGRRYSVGGIYVPLNRLVEKAWLLTEDGYPGPERLGRPRRLFKITASGLAQLRTSQQMHRQLWAGVPDLIIQKLRLT